MKEYVNVLVRVAFSVITASSLGLYFYSLSSKTLIDYGDVHLWGSVWGGCDATWEPSIFSGIFLAVGIIMSIIILFRFYMLEKEVIVYLSVLILFSNLIPFLVASQLQTPFSEHGYYSCSNERRFALEEKADRAMNCIIVGTYTATASVVITRSLIAWLPAWFAGMIAGIFIPWEYLNFLLFASIGYAVGEPLGRWMERRMEIREMRERIRREEERRRKEYEQKMKELELKLKRWKEEGYDVSELEEELRKCGK